MNFYQVSEKILISLGIVGLMYSLYPAGRIINEIQASHISQMWKALRFLIILFIVGYVSFMVMSVSGLHLGSLIVAIVFFLGSLFVVFVCSLTLNTVKDLKRLDVLKIESITDELTGMYNRRHLERCLDKEISKAKAYNCPLSLLMLDLDHYKEVNDRHGHLAGDQVLKCTSERIKNTLRRVDTVARYGGDEIVVLLPDTDKPTARLIADRLRSSAGTISSPIDGKNCKCTNLHCTVSVGVVTMTDHKINGRQLLKMADTALYHAKNSGRNRTVEFEQDMLTA